MFNFDGKVVMVAGAAGNLGAAVTEAFARSGANLALVDRSEDQLRDQFAALAQSGDHFLANCADMTDPASVGEAVERILNHHGRIDVFVTVVGGFRAGTPLHETPLDTYDFLMNLNARSYFISARAVIPGMLEKGEGRIIGVAARPGLQGAENMAAYSASKSAVIRMTESMAEELKHDHITVNCLLPGTLDTPQNREAQPDADYGRWVKPESLAEVILFLASESARDISGAAVPVYGRS